MAAALFDLDGVLYESDSPIAGAADTVNWFRKNKIPHLFLTNTTSKSREQLVEKLAGFGIDCQANEFLTPPVAAIQWMSEKGIKDIALFVPASTQAEFAQFSLHEEEDDKVDAVVIGDLGEQWDFATMNRVFRLLINNPDAKLIALGMTRYWRNKGKLQLDAGPIVKAIEYATGRKPRVTGKPAKPFYKAAMSLLGKKKIIMIGDDIYGDIEAAHKAGLKAILVKTGKFTPADLELGIKPKAIIDSVADLPKWWEMHM